MTGHGAAPRAFPARDPAGNLRIALLAAALGCALLAGADGGRALWLAAKATLAQHLLERAWERGGGRPWPWADVRGVARLDVPSVGASFVVLDGSSGEALAFGPGLVAGDPDGAGTVVLGGHRDTHLRFLADVSPGTEIRLRGAGGTVRRYRTLPGITVDVRTHTLAVDAARDGLVLVTCWPFDAPSAGGPLRRVVRAVPISDDRGTTGERPGERRKRQKGQGDVTTTRRPSSG